VDVVSLQNVPQMQGHGSNNTELHELCTKMALTVQIQ